MRRYSPASVVFLVMVVALCAAIPGLALETRSGDMVTVPKESTVDDDLAAAGQNVSVTGNVAGDALLAGQSVRVAGSTKGTLFAAGNTVDVTGSIGRSAWLAGSTVMLSSVVPGNAALAGSNVTFADTSRVGRDLMAAGTNVAVQGTVGRNLKAAGTNVTVAGTVNGDAQVDATNLSVADGAVIRGNLNYTSPNKASIASGAKILGKVTHKVSKPHKEKRGLGVGWSIYWLLATLLFGVVLTALYPVRSLAAGRLAISAFWRSILWGLLILIIAPAVIIIVMITVIGIPLGLVLLASYLIMLFASRIYAGIGLGDWILRKAGRASPHAMLSMLIGVVIIALLSLIPLVGGLVSLVALLVGLGAAILDWIGWVRGLRARSEV